MADYDSPPPYSGGQENDAGDRLGCYMSYVKSLPGILKIVEIVLGLVTFICASANSVWILPQYGGGFVQFTGIMACIISAVLFIFRVSNLISKIPGPIPFIEFIYYIVIVICFLISGVLSSVRATVPWIVQYPDGHTETHSSAAIGAAAFFSFACSIVFGVGCFFAFKQWRSGTVSRPPATQQAEAQYEPEPAAQDDFSKY